MGASFLYESAKDNLKWMNISVKDHVQEVMQIGNLIFLSDENYEKHKAKSISETTSVKDMDEAFAEWKAKNK